MYFECVGWYRMVVRGLVPFILPFSLSKKDT